MFYDLNDLNLLCLSEYMENFRSIISNFSKKSSYAFQRCRFLLEIRHLISITAYRRLFLFIYLRMTFTMCNVHVVSLENL